MSNTHFVDIHGHSWPCTQKQKDWLEAYQAEAIRRTKAGKTGYIKYGLDILQIIGGAAASAGTHLEDPSTHEAVCIDIANVSYEMIALAREMGGDAGWHRKKNWDGKGGGEHGHLNLRGIVNRYANYQYSSTTQGVDHGHNGLASHGKDDGPKPLSKRTYKQGIEHAAALAAGAPPPPPPPTVIPDTALTFGYWNLFGTYKPTDIDKARFRAQIGLMRTMKISLLVALELHEENGAKGMLAWYKLELAKYGFAVAEGKGGNHLIHDPKKYKIVWGKNKSMGTRWASKWSVKRLDTGRVLLVGGFHTPAGSTPARILARSTETKRFLAWLAEDREPATLIGIDKNNGTDKIGTPTRQLRQGGFSNLYNVLAIENEKFRSHHDYDKKGHLIADQFHIDAIEGGRAVTFTDGKQWQTGALADHDALVAKVLIKGVAA